ncbi:MAG TPA: hypothetical protein VGM56_19415 [Byssovorax sp.]|jgi:hypothetical protein
MTQAGCFAAVALLAGVISTAVVGCDQCPSDYDCSGGTILVTFEGGVSTDDIMSFTASAACGPVPAELCDSSGAGCNLVAEKENGFIVTLDAGAVGDCDIRIVLKSGVVVAKTVHVTEVTGDCCSGLVSDGSVTVPVQP